VPGEAPQAMMEPAKQEALAKKWLGEIDDALKREKKFRETAQRCVDLYEAKKPDETPFAILYSNTEVLAPSVYNTDPIPIVSRRFKDPDPLGKAVAEVSTRTLKYLIEAKSQDYDSFGENMQAAVLDALITNRGLTRYKYVPHENGECVYGEAVRWDKFLHGYARTWKKVPWVCFEWDMTEAELRKNFPDAQLDEGRIKSGGTVDSEDEKAESREQLTGVKLFKVYEIWNKITHKVMFFSKVAPKCVLRMVDDPLGLSGFFPIPKPLNFMRKITTLVPTPLYEQYRQQAAELNEITRRLKNIIKAIKYRGAYNGAIEGIDKMLAAGDEELVPLENLQSMPDGMGIDRMLWIVPVQELAATAQSLYVQREQVKSVIYEITGISDIIRGSSAASETATAQNIKAQWGTLRLKRMQREVQRYCKDSLEIELEIAAGKFDIQTLAQMTGAPYMTMEKKQGIQLQVQQMKAMAQQATQQAQMTGQPAPPPPPPLPAELEQALAAPSWEDIQNLLRNQLTLHYKVDIETNSTIDAEASQDKQDISELLNALSQFMNGLAPLVEGGMMPFSVAKDMLLVISRRYNFGSQLEDSINSMAQPPAPGPDPTQEAKAEADKATAQATVQKMQMQMQMDKANFEQDRELMMLQAQIKKAEFTLQLQGIEAKAAQAAEQHRLKMEGLRGKALVDQMKHTQGMEVAEEKRETEDA